MHIRIDLYQCKTRIGNEFSSWNRNWPGMASPGIGGTGVGPEMMCSGIGMDSELC